ncbi:LacI family DNA-binding transcriptional regulator [Glycomyces algeriensis]|uniref:Transcriptional regulator n=2 Tax=Glycomyces algeriensis TaxID=256037 RepID=A0A9W6LGI8_9ACTN|nr:LacI family DNA-binding transcriptional regulator [Glycomyces algeriensis]MDR7350325.1 DNA-binding LacI/PurR family transcriptional regulator [Glycomyces algeriensis]GLI43032.1 transcriptional regulator [Glycomyces algeriensis]
MADQEYSRPRPRRRREGITIQDVADVAGVSIGTVSRVLNDRNWVSPATREKVMDAVRKTGFTANARARALVMQRTSSVALVLGAAPTALFEDPNYALILQEASRELAAANYSLVFLTAADAAERDRVAAFIRAGHVDGVMFVSPAESGHDPLLDLLESRALPVVVCGNPFAEARRLALVRTDDAPGCEALGRHFRDQGYRRTAAIAAYPDTLGPQQRIEAFTRGLGRDLAHLQPASQYSQADGYAAMAALLDGDLGIDSVFATSDLLAAGAIDALRARGLEVPGDIAVAGFDDSAVATRSAPALTTVHQPVAAVAQAMVREVLQAIDGTEATTRVLPTELIIRESA